MKQKTVQLETCIKNIVTRHILSTGSRLYTVTVCSLMTYGCGSWTLTDKVNHMLNGDNSQMLSHNLQVEARRVTTSHDIIKHTDMS